MPSFTLQELADLTQSKLTGNPSYRITGVEDLEAAGSEEISFCSHPRYLPLLQKTRAGAICVDPQIPLIDGKNFLISDLPSDTFQQLINLFLTSEDSSSGFKGIHPTAVIHPSSKIGEGVHIGPYVVIDQGCEVGDHTIIHAGSCLGSLVKLGAHCLIYPHVTIREKCILGDRVILQPGAVIGSCGFGYTTNAKGEHIKQKQLGIVVLEDDVEIGSGTRIDRARFKETRICKGTKIDNLVQIGHNVRLGPFNLIVSQTGISGSVRTGKYVVMGGQTGTVGHIDIADGALFAARSGIKKSIKKAGKYGGNPAISLDAHNREQVYLKRVADYGKKIQALEQKIQELEDSR
jgi:UDP-3-O-[3-hydroxymyristoyl] glucosamine N-acyltransferase